MSSERTHTCVYFDDGDLLEHVCGCGRRALYLLDDEVGDLLVVLADERATVTTLVTAGSRPRRELAVSA